MLRAQAQPAHEILLVRKGTQVDAQFAQVTSAVVSLMPSICVRYTPDMRNNNARAPKRISFFFGLRLRRFGGNGRLRVQDINLERNSIHVRAGKGDKDRVVLLPRTVRAALQRQLQWRKELHERDLARGVARVELPDALERKYLRAAQDFGWQFVFASRQMSRCPRTQRLGRHHLYEASLQRAVAQAGVAAGLDTANARVRHDPMSNG
jgi:integrase